MMLHGFEESAAAYYSEKLQRHGPSPAGVDWNTVESQELRFEQLLKVCPSHGEFSLLDFGCGYGALLTFLQKRAACPDYWGYDVAPAMVKKARELHGGTRAPSFLETWSAVPMVDYAVASGVFNVKQQASHAEWQPYVGDCLQKMANVSRRGFAFNLLTTYSDPDRMRSDLYYGDPCYFFDYCKTRFSRHVGLLHDYGLYEFTILVRLSPS
jgi:SAM-dependent methyltransferase